MKILIVDDCKMTLFVITKILKELGYTDIITAQDPEMAVIRIRSSTPDLIISDWNMPKGSGLDFLKFIRSDKKIADIPFIFLTTVHDKNKIESAKKYNPQAFVLKPPKKDMLNAKLLAISETHDIQPPIDQSKNSVKPISTTYGTQAPIKSEEKLIKQLQEYINLYEQNELSEEEYRNKCVEILDKELKFECSNNISSLEKILTFIEDLSKKRAFLEDRDIIIKRHIFKKINISDILCHFSDIKARLRFLNELNDMKWLSSEDFRELKEKLNENNQPKPPQVVA